MNTTHRNKYLLAILVFALVFVSCTQEDDTIVTYSNIKTVEYKVAVVLPINETSGYKERFTQTVEWALTNMRNAQRGVILQFGDTTAVDLQIEWYDEDDEDLNRLARQLADREDIFLTIGPLHNKNIDLMAPAFADANKPLIVPCGSSEEIIRKYSVGTAGVQYKKPFLWSLSETDISQCEALLAKAWEGNAKTIGLLTPDDVYGKTFFEWIPFLSTELQMEMQSCEQYKGVEDVREKATVALNSHVDCVICVTDDPQVTQQVLEVRQQMGSKAPRILFSHGALSSKLLELGNLSEGVEGVAQYADPSTGFQIAYEGKFGMMPAGIEAQLYDAVLLAGFAAYVQDMTGTNNANEIIRQITSGESTSLRVWNELGIRSLIYFWWLNQSIELIGASGLLQFDKEAYTSLIRSAYVHWMVYDQRLISIDYLSSDGANRTEATLASWNWQAKEQQTIFNQDVNIHYEPLEERWAVLVQGSNEWKNYRHQADVLNMYQFLKRNGYDDDHIILILADEIAHHANNKYPGEVRTNPSRENLYQNLQVDYSTDTLTINDVQDILSGKSSEHLPVVLNTDAHSNVLVFWSGHGTKASVSNAGKNGFVWRDTQECLDDKAMKALLTDMSTRQRFRKMLLLFEPCYSETMIQQAEGIPGILAFSSSKESEQSFADYYSMDLLTWMSDRFSNNIVTCLEQNPHITWKEFYSYLSAHTLGSHVRLANASNFGNLYVATFDEFLQANN